MTEPKRKSQSFKYTQQKFIKATTVRRNKKIFNIQQIDAFETMEQRRRRTPYKSITTSEMDEKFSSFMNSTTVNSYKLQTQISKHKQKVHSSHTPSRKNTRYVFFDHQQLNQQPTDSKQIGQQAKGISMDKMLTRQYCQSLEKKQSQNQVRFNNYCLYEPEKDKVRAFEKYLSREQLQKLHLQKVPDSNPQIPIIYEKIAYPSNTFAVNWDYKKQKWSRGPIYFKVNKQNSINLTQIPKQKLDKAQQNICTRWSKTIIHFKSLSDKEEPSQFQRTFYPPNMKFRLKKPKVQARQKLIKIKSVKKHDKFQRDQICNLKYFRLYHPKTTLEPEPTVAEGKEYQNNW